MTPKFKKGDVVKVKSGSPKMTIESIYGKAHPTDLTKEIPQYHCIWVEDNGGKQKADFLEESLEHAE